MLLNRATADGIADGSITLVLRRWDTARAKPGGTQRTPAGTIRIDDVVEYPADYRVTAEQARAAGYRDAAAAHTELDRRPASHLYVIKVSYAGAAERPALAADDALTTLFARRGGGFRLLWCFRLRHRCRTGRTAKSVCDQRLGHDLLRFRRNDLSPASKTIVPLGSWKGSPTALRPQGYFRAAVLGATLTAAE